MDDVSRPEVGQLRERLFIEHGRRLPNLADNSSHVRPASHGDGPAQTLETRASVDPVHRVRGRQTSRHGRREGANGPGRNGIFGLSNFRPRRHCHYGRGAYWRCRSSSKECRTTDKFHRRVLEGCFFTKRNTSLELACFPAWRQ